MAETPLHMAGRHVAAGERLCARQERLISHMISHGLDTAEAEMLLANMRVTLMLMRDHWEDLKRESKCAL